MWTLPALHQYPFWGSHLEISCHDYLVPSGGGREDKPWKSPHQTFKLGLSVVCSRMLKKFYDLLVSFQYVWGKWLLLNLTMGEIKLGH